MKFGWQSEPLDTLCDFRNGLWKGKKPPFVDAWVIRNTNFTPEGTLDETDVALLSVEEKQFKSRQLEFGDIILEKSGGGPKQPVGRVIVFEKAAGNYSFSNFTSVIRIKDKNKLDYRFLHRLLLFFYLSGLTEPLQRRSTGIRNLVFSEYKKLPIPIPSLLEQKRIVAILDEAFEGIDTAIANAEKNLANARELFESHLQTVLLDKKWPWKKLGDLCERVEYGSAAKSKPTGSVPVLRMGNIQDGKIDWENLVYSDDADEIARYSLSQNDVLFNRTNSPELVGKAAIYKGETPAIFAGYLIRIHRKEDLLDADFLNYFLNSRFALNYGKTVMSSSVNQANINGTKLKGYPIPVPSLTDQQTIVSELRALSDQCERLDSVYRERLDRLSEIKQSILHKAFSGELTQKAA